VKELRAAEDDIGNEYNVAFGRCVKKNKNFFILYLLSRYANAFF
jgi:hypothetical protein